MTSGLVILWGGLAAAAAVGVAVLVRTRWLQTHTLGKCALVSVALHGLLALVCACVGGLRPASWGTSAEGRMSLTVVVTEEPAADAGGSDTIRASEPPRAFAGEVAAQAADAVPVAADVTSVTSRPAEPPSDLVPLLEISASEETTVSAGARTDVAREIPAAAGAAGEATAISPPALPEPYADRFGGRRVAAAVARGGSADTERAVQAALAWLAAAQGVDGRWEAARHGAGVERALQGHHRQGAGARGDHGVTGLALLAFLGAGQTHREGPHASVVRRGVEALVARQRTDGSLAGDAEFFAALYCHGMATIALAECCGITGDPALRPALDRAVRHTLAMQHPVTGGWRYAAGDRGDTSQLGWQVMVLTSARHAGLVGLEPAEARARTFLSSVSLGAAGGLASYRPGGRASVTMTAEALVCRLLLGMPAEHPAAAEALALVAASPPDRGSPNAYTWYYATLASFHVGGPQWEDWNARLQAAILPLQHQSGPHAGSWDPDPVWGGHGGRVYATALAAMTLEVYYRYLPLSRAAPRMAFRPETLRNARLREFPATPSVGMPGVGD